MFSRAGVGKTCAASWLAGLPGWSYQLGESPGVRTTQVPPSHVGAFDLENCVKVYWPARVAGKLLLFRLQLWDAGDAAVRKYGHVYPVCRCKDSSSLTTIDLFIREGASGVLLVFSYTDRASWEELPGLIQRTVMQVSSIRKIILTLPHF